MIKKKNSKKAQKSVKPKKEKITIENVYYRLKAMSSSIHGLPRDFHNETVRIWDHLIEKINNANTEFKNRQRQEMQMLEQEIRKKHDLWHELMHGQLVRIADDSMRATQALQRMLQVIDEAVFTPEIKQSIINKIRAIPNGNVG